MGLMPKKEKRTLVEIPEGVSEQSVRWAIENLRSEAEKHRAAWSRAEKILDSDDALNEWVRKMSFGRTSPIPIVRAAVYERSVGVPRGHEIIGRWEPFEGLRNALANDPRRPVIMRGSFECLVQRHALNGGYCANGYALKVLERYLRYTKFTCFSVDEFNDGIDAASNRIHEKISRLGGTISYHFGNHTAHFGCLGINVPRPDEPNEWGDRFGEKHRAETWVGGRQVRLTRHQFEYLKALHRIGKTAKTPEQRRLALKARRLDLDGMIVRPVERTRTRPAATPPLDRIGHQKKKAIMLKIAAEVLAAQNIDLERVFEDAQRSRHPH